MPALKDLTDYLDELLELDAYPLDPSNNGLQFQGNNEVKKAVFAVDACEATFSIAAEMEADFIFVHHGISWGNGFKRLNGSLAQRVSLLANNKMSLYAAHLPLDAHEMLGHNAILADLLGLEDVEPFGTYHGYKIGVKGTLKKKMSLGQIAALYQDKLPSEGDFKGMGDFDRKIQTVSIISGGGSWDELYDEIANSDVEAHITGDYGHESWHPAMEAGVPVLGLGHYRSETPGVIAVMNTVREQFKIDVEFIDVPTYL